MNPKVSIIVPVYNAEQYMEKCLNSILKQTFEDFELIIIDDGSRDNSLKILKKFKNLEKVRIYSQNNSGPSVTRNKGIEKANGEYIVFIDIDDWIEKDYIENLVEEIEKKRLDFVVTGYKDISKYGIININDFYTENENLKKEKILLKIFNGTGGVPWGKIYKRNIIIENKIKMDKKIFMCEDQLFVLEYLLNSKTIGILNTNKYNYNRLNENSISNKMDLKYYDNFLFYLEKLESILKKYKVEKKVIQQVMTIKINSIYEVMIMRLYLDSHIKNKINHLKFFSNELKNRYFYLKNTTILEKLKNEEIYKVHFLFLLRKMKIKLKEFIKFKLIRRGRN